MNIDGLVYFKIKAVFIHELGHFVAKEINHRFYSGSGTSEILIYPCEQNPNEFVGCTNVIIPENDDKNQPIALHKLAEHIASLSYGCFFQAYYSSIPLRFCQCNYGKDDEKRKMAGLLLHHIGQISSEIEEIENEYFNKLASKAALQHFMSLNPENYLIDRGKNKYEVNIEKLRHDTSEYVNGHYNIYEGLISKYEEVIQKQIAIRSRC